MRYLTWLVYCAVFLALFAFTLKNTTPVTLHGLLDAHWDAPLIVFLFVFFVAGCVLGLMAMVPPLVKAKRELAEVKRQIKRDVERPAPISPDLVEPAVPLDAVI
ncbi:MAG: LapA family protein [Burkholderiales bacterium]|nr:LapA family protein [Burkholderiales bacterium]